MVLSIFTTNGGHLGFSVFYGSDFDRFFLSVIISSRIENRFETFCYNFWGSGGISTQRLRCWPTLKSIILKQDPLFQVSDILCTGTEI